MLDLDKIGPDWKIAQQHGLACSPGYPLRFSTSAFSNTSINLSPIPHRSQGHEICECCLNIVHKQPIPLCENSKQLQFLGFGFPLFFIFTKYAIILLILQIFAYNALSITWALESSSDLCDGGHVRELPGGAEGSCTSWLIRFMRTETVVSRDEIVLRLSSFLIHLMGLLYMRDTIKKTSEYYHERTISISEYSVIISKLPCRIGTGGRIREFMQAGASELPYVVEELVLLGYLEDYYYIQEEKNAVIREKQAWLRKPEGEERTIQLAALDRKLASVSGKLEQEHAKQIELIKNDEAICDKAIIVLESEDAKEDFLEKFKKLSKEKLGEFFGEGAQKIHVKTAPQPEDIIWENINYPAEKQAVRLVIGWTLTLIFLLAVTGVFYGLLLVKGHAVEGLYQEIDAHPDHPDAAGLEQRAIAATMLTMLSIIFFNKFILSFVLHLFTDIEKHRTGSKYEFSFALKYTLGLFFTSALMTLLVEDFGLHNIYKEEYGVVEEQSIMFFFNAFLVPIIWLINPWYLFKQVKRWWLKGRTDLTQREAHELMEDPKYSIGKKYAELIESVWFAYLYSTVIPMGCILVLLGVIFFYWVDKLTLLRKASINQHVDGYLSIRAMRLIDLTLFMGPIGQIIFDAQIRDGVGWQSILCVCIGGVYLFLPLDEILAFFHEQKFKSEENLYKDVKDMFTKNYHTMHPLFAKERYALSSGLDITMRTNLAADIKEVNNQRLELQINRQPNGELKEENENWTAIVEVHPSKHNITFQLGEE